MRRRDDGFTLIEVLVSIALISVVTSALTMFFVQSRAATVTQSQFRQAAQMASAVMEQVSLLPGLSLVSGRPASCVSDQWSPASGSPVTAPPAQVRTYLNAMTALPDVSLTQTVTPVDCISTAQTGTETLPTQQVKQMTVNGSRLSFTQNIYIGTCGVLTTSANGTTGACVKTGGLATVRIVVAITWNGKCAGGTCLYLTDSLVPQAVSDIVFNLP